MSSVKQAPFEDDMFGGVLGVEPLQQEPRGSWKVDPSCSESGRAWPWCEHLSL